APRPPRSTPFPYTTLFRSPWKGRPSLAQAGPLRDPLSGRGRTVADCGRGRGVAPAAAIVITGPQAPVRQAGSDLRARPSPVSGRSEEHTSELQSRENLVCR